MRFYLALWLFLSLSELYGSAANAVVKTLPGDSTKEVTVPYRTRNKMIVVPFLINDSIKANLILDDRCKSLILFGRRYKKLLAAKDDGAKVNGEIKETISADNKISIGIFSSSSIPIVVVPNHNLLNYFTAVHGVVGDDIFSRFEVVVHKESETVTFRPLPNGSLTAHIIPSSHADQPNRK